MARGKRGRPPGMDGPTRATVLRLFDAGATVAAIARALGVSRQAVSAHLRRSGRDPAAAKAELVRAGWRRFAAVWNAAPDVGTAARALGLTEREARQRAGRLRAA